jgi:hypothetical protein
LRSRQAANRLQQVVTALLTLFRSGAEVKWQSVALADLLTHLHFDKLTLTASPAVQIALTKLDVERILKLPSLQ